MPGRRKGLEQPLLPLTPSPLRTSGTSWLTSPSYQQVHLLFSAIAFHSVTDALLENPNLNSTHLFRADIIFDSSGRLKTNKQKEDYCRSGFPQLDSDSKEEGDCTGEDGPRNPVSIAGFELSRTVLRRLVPRKTRLDRPLLQTCHIYTSDEANVGEPDQAPLNDEGGQSGLARLSIDETFDDRPLCRQSITRHSQHLLIYQPHVDRSTGADMPWYHPPVKLLAFLFETEHKSLFDSDSPDSDRKKEPQSSLSIHFQLFGEEHSTDSPPSVTNRLHRTLLSLLSTFVRMAHNTPVSLDEGSGEEKAMPISATQDIKDNIIPEHLVQNTYSRLKTLYASELIHRWVEKTDPTKHVFEDLSIAAFLMELWKKLYGCNHSDFPGFVDVACGNGVLVYVLLMEGYHGWGFDARVRRTWSIFPESVTPHLKEMVCIPKPFLEALRSQAFPFPNDMQLHDGIFGEATFIISNHADELTTWTPVLAALSCPQSPLPWLAIPCCSHALSGVPHRYQSTTSRSGAPAEGLDIGRHQHGDRLGADCQEQLATGDLAQLRAMKYQNAERVQQGQSKRTNSTYASLVDKVMCLATEFNPLGDVYQTLMRIPSTRNIGVLGGLGSRRMGAIQVEGQPNRDIPRPAQAEEVKLAELNQQINQVVAEECRSSGGVSEAAKMWMKGAIQARGTTRHAFNSA